MSLLGLYDLLTPYFLAGAVFDERHDPVLSQLGVVELSTAYDDSAVLHTGTLQLGAGTAPRLTSRRGSAGFTWDTAQVRFRLTVPRDGRALVDTAIGAAPIPQLARVARLHEPNRLLRGLRHGRSPARSGVRSGSSTSRRRASPRPLRRPRPMLTPVTCSRC